MAEYDSNMIKPVEGLENFSRLNPMDRREERKHRQQLQEQNDEENESFEEKSKESINEDLTRRPEVKTDNSQNPDSVGIDFRA